jgi:hypothetical protein
MLGDNLSRSARDKVLEYRHLPRTPVEAYRHRFGDVHPDVSAPRVILSVVPAVDRSSIWSAMGVLDDVTILLNLNSSRYPGFPHIT